MEKGFIITAIGMGLVFVLIILLWFIMALLVKLTENFKGSTEEEAPVEAEELVQTVAAPVENNAQLAAALAAATVVAMSRKVRKPLSSKPQPSSPASGSLPSSWLNAGRVRQILARKGR